MPRKIRKCAQCANFSEKEAFGWCLYGGSYRKNLTCADNPACKKFVRKGVSK